jgi:hypothetical protein
LTPSKLSFESARRYIIAFVILAWLAVNLATLNLFPTISCDEAFYSIAGTRLIRTLAHQPVLNPERDYTVIISPYGRINLLGQGLFNVIFGINPTSSRLWGLLGWAACVAGVYWSGKKFVEERLAYWAAGLTAAAWLLLYYGHNGRPHIWVSAIAIWTLGLLKSAVDEPTPGRLFLAAFFPAFMLEMHPNSMHFVIASVCILGVNQLREKRYRSIGWIASGVLLAVPVYIAARFVPFDASLTGGGKLLNAFAIYALPSGQATSGNIVADILHSRDLVAESVAFVTWWYGNYVLRTWPLGIIQAALFGLGIIACVLTKEREKRLIVIYYAISSISFIVLTTHKWSNYSIIWIPLLLLMAVYGMVWLFQVTHLSHRVSPVWGLGLFALLYLSGDIYLMRAHVNRGFLDSFSSVRAHVEPGSTVFGSAQWWYALPDTNFATEFIAIQGGGTVPRYTTSDKDIAAFMKDVLNTELDVDYVFVDDYIGCHAETDAAALALKAAVEEQCTPIDTYTVRRSTGVDAPTTLYACLER